MANADKIIEQWFQFKIILHSMLIIITTVSGGGTEACRLTAGQTNGCTEERNGRRGRTGGYSR